MLLNLFKYLLLFTATLLCVGNLLAQTKAYETAFLNSIPKLDGDSTDACWQMLPIASNFIQTIPKPLEPSNYATRVRVGYTNDALYILAILETPKNEQLNQITERDNLSNINADMFGVFFDTYSDNQNGFAFKVSSSNVQQDERLSNGGTGEGGWDGNADIGWDGVWLSKTKMYDNYWVVEMEIPYSSLRFSKNEIQNWNLQFTAMHRKTNERSYWNKVDPNANGFFNQAGKLLGLKNIKPPLRLALFPYLGMGYQSVPTNGTNVNTTLPSGGMDFKLGLNDAFTLDASLVPDFSQVISDNLVRNLSVFEQQLSENRPFFTEGTELFNKQNMLYTRRIGGRPNGYYDVAFNYGDTAKFTIEKNPNVTQLLNSIKISGRTKGKTGIGLFNAISAPMNASVFDKISNTVFKINTAPAINYNMIVIDQAFSGQNYLNISNTNVVQFNKDISVNNVLGLQTELFNKKQTFSVAANVKHSFDELSANANGIYYSLRVGKVGGKLQYSAGSEYFSTHFNQTAMGIQFNRNHMQNRYSISYNNNTPKLKKWQIIRYWLNTTLEHNVQPWDLKKLDIDAGVFNLFKNFWDISFYLNSSPFRMYDYYSLNGRKLMNNGYVYFGTEGSSDSRKKLYTWFSIGRGINFENTNWSYMDGRLGVRYMFTDKFNLSTSFNFERNHATVGNTFYFEPQINDYLLGYRQQNEYTWDINGKYNISPNLSINGRFRHYNAKIIYKNYYSLLPDGDWLPLNIIPTENVNENFNLQNIDLFFNWIFKPGSRMVISYKQWLNDTYVLNNELDNRFTKNVTRVANQPQAWAVSARVIWYIDYQQMRKLISKE